MRRKPAPIVVNPETYSAVAALDIRTVSILWCYMSGRSIDDRSDMADLEKCGLGHRATTSRAHHLSPLGSDVWTALSAAITVMVRREPKARWSPSSAVCCELALDTLTDLVVCE